MALTKVSIALFVLFAYDVALLIILLAIITLLSRTKRGICSDETKLQRVLQ